MIFQSFALPSFSTLKTHKIGMTKIWHINKENTCSNPHFWVSEKKFDFQSLASHNRNLVSNIILDFWVIPCKIKNNLSPYPWKEHSVASKHANFQS